jgi:hypothetical protein
MHTDYNIEFAHMYSDQDVIGEEQIKSVDVVKRVVKKLERRNKSYVLCVLLDEYHPLYQKLNINRFLSRLKEEGVSPTYIGYESRLIPAASILLKVIPPELQEYHKMRVKIMIDRQTVFLHGKDKDIPLKTLGKLKEFNRYTCSILAAAWYLLRLGMLQAKDAYEITGLTEPKPFVAKNLINILQKKYKEPEDEAMDIIGNTNFKKHASRIETVYF